MFKICRGFMLDRMEEEEDVPNKKAPKPKYTKKAFKRKRKDLQSCLEVGVSQVFRDFVMACSAITSYNLIAF